MYQTTVKGEGLFQALSQGYGEPVRAFGVTEQGETPVSLVNIGLAACITMCVCRATMPAKKAIKPCLFRWRVAWTISVLKC
ncbi:OsmC-like protein [Streptococcus suis]|uniref:OsmC-like protein n=1 Tax=Streptococcus suis TaxID=1307 RepID=A0A0Z8FKC0_STRSU|nr:OsmC-like protein [Streptococcus suis]